MLRNISRKYRHRALSLLTVALALAAAGGTTAVAQETAHVAFIGTKSSSFLNAIFRGLTSVQGTTADFIEVGWDANKQSQAIDDAVVSGKYKAIVMMPNSPTGLIPAAKRAIEAGVQVLNVGATLGPDILSNDVQLEGQTASIVEPFDHLGRLQAQLGLQACREKNIKPCKIARIGGLPQFGTEQIFTRVTTEEIKAAGTDAELVATTYSGGYGAADGLKSAQDLLISHPDVNVILSSDPQMKGIEQAVKMAGADVQLVGIGGSVLGMKKVQSGVWYGDVAFFPEYAGRLAGQVILKHVADTKLKGESISSSQPGVGPAFTKKDAASFSGQYDG